MNNYHMAHNRLLDMWKKYDGMPPKYKATNSLVADADNRLIIDLRVARRKGTSRWDSRFLNQPYSEAFFPDPCPIQRHKNRMGKIYDTYLGMPPCYNPDGSRNKDYNYLTGLKRSRLGGKGFWHDSLLDLHFANKLLA